MPLRNLNPEAVRSKGRLPGALSCLLAIASVLILAPSGCNNNSGNPLNAGLPSGFSLEGTYFLTQRSLTTDGTNYQVEYPPSTAGVMLVYAEDSAATTDYGYPAYYYSRNYVLASTAQTDSGLALMSGKSVYLVNPPDSLINTQGTYDDKADWIQLNYTKYNYLYTETWKKVKAVAVPTNNNPTLPLVP